MQTQVTESAHYFVRGLFRGMPETPQICDQREELEAHINDRVSDNMARGMGHDEAFAKVVESLGNLDELIETMTGRKKKVYINRLSWHMMAIGIVYGTLYMVAVGVWFGVRGLGANALYLAATGWLGYVVPALLKLALYLRNPKATRLIDVDNADEVKVSVIGWICITVACWAINAVFMRTDMFLNSVWAWMPMVGLFTWPLMEAAFLMMARRQAPIEN